MTGRFGPPDTPYTIERITLGSGRVAHLVVTLRPEVREAVLHPDNEDELLPWLPSIHVDDGHPLCGSRGHQATAEPRLRTCKFCDQLLEDVDAALNRERMHLAEVLAQDEIRAAIDARIPEVGW